MPYLDVFQSLWAMSAYEESAEHIDTSVERIIDAGYAGINLVMFPEMWAQNEACIKAIAGTSLDVTLTTQPGYGGQSLGDMLDQVQASGARVRHVTLVPQIMPRIVNDCVEALQSWLEQGEERGVPLYLETHRNSITQCPDFTGLLLEAMPHLWLEGDLAHFVIAQEWDEFRMHPDHKTLIDLILKRCGAFQGRVASSTQAQVQIDFPQHQMWVEMYKKWWEFGFRAWREHHANEPDARLVFVNELGPPPYAITDSQGNELSDRWQEALTIKTWVEGIWTNLDAT